MSPTRPLRSSRLPVASGLVVGSVLALLLVAPSCGAAVLQEKQDGSWYVRCRDAGQGRASEAGTELEGHRPLVDEQKFQKALEAVEIRLQAARGTTDDNELTRALVKATQLRIGLHGYETAVRFLREQPWPPSVLARTTLRLFYAHALVTYTQAYSWEIGQRERVESTEVLDLKAWTRDEIVAEALRAYGEVWSDRESFGGERSRSSRNTWRRTTTRPRCAARCATRSPTSPSSSSPTPRSGALSSRTRCISST